MPNLWEYRSLVKKLAFTDLKIRYKNSVLGLVWSLLQPLFMFLVLYLVFTSVFKNNSIENYPLFLLMGIISWGFFDKATGFSLNSIVGKPSLIKKIYFPREVLVISSCLTALMMSCIELVVFGAFMLAFGVLPAITILLLPVVLFIEFLFTLGISLAIASLNVRYRDIQWIWGVVMQAGFFATPIMYSMSLFEGSTLAGILGMNPIGLIIEMMRDVTIYRRVPALADGAYIIIATLALLAIGYAIFRYMEPVFAEEV
jgi:lipopolysaccharide transport system permease protein